MQVKEVNTLGHVEGEDSLGSRSLIEGVERVVNLEVINYEKDLGDCLDQHVRESAVEEVN